MNKRTCVVVGIIAGLLTVGGSTVQAARIFFLPQEVTVGRETEVSMFLDTEREDINAVEMTIRFDPSSILIRDINDGDSALALWIERPRFSNVDGVVTFSGIIPGGYESGQARLAGLRLVTRQEGNVEFRIENSRVLLNDGLGTRANLVPARLLLTAAEKVYPEVTIVPSDDTYAPELFQPRIIHDPNIFDGLYVLVFAAQDKGSGIDYYAVHESRTPKTFVSDSEWQRAESPYPLKDQRRTQYVYIKAVDKSGNARIVAVELASQRWWQQYHAWSIIIGGVLAVLAAGLAVFIRRLQKKRNER